jgi:hypothetical protein
LRGLDKDWITKYIEYVSGATESPECYHFWSAATCIAATLKRHVWIDRGTYKLYPNIFAVLVGRPGIGKGGALNPAASILREANCCHMLSDRVTIEYVLEKLSKGFPATQMTSSGNIQFGNDSSAVIFSPELSIFITASQHTLPILADLWDSREGEFSYGTRHKGDYKIKNSCVSLLAGSTQEWLISSIPSNAVGGGFTRRVNFVFAKDKQAFIPWPHMNHSNLRTKLIDDLRVIGQVQGEFKFNSDAEKLFEDYYRSAIAEEFDDEATTAYKTTKWAHAAKLSMAIAVASDNRLLIDKICLQQAIDRVEEVLKSIGLVFRAVGESDLVVAADRVLRYIESKGFATKSEILRANWRHISDVDLQTVLATFVQGGLLLEHVSGNKIFYECPQIKKGVKIP